MQIIFFEIESFVKLKLTFKRTVLKCLKNIYKILNEYFFDEKQRNSSASIDKNNNI